MNKNLVIFFIFSFLLLSCAALNHEKVDTKDRPSSGKLEKMLMKEEEFHWRSHWKERWII